MNHLPRRQRPSVAPRGFDAGTAELEAAIHGHGCTDHFTCQHLRRSGRHATDLGVRRLGLSLPHSLDVDALDQYAWWRAMPQAVREYLCMTPAQRADLGALRRGQAWVEVATEGDDDDLGYVGEVPALDGQAA